MDKKYVNFYMRFHKAFQNKKSNSLLELNQSRSSRYRRGYQECNNYVFKIIIINNKIYV